MRRVVPRRGSSAPAGGTAPAGTSSSRKSDLALWVIGGLVLVSIAGFAAYYYYDRYYHPDEKLLDRQAQHIEAMVEKNPQNPDLRVAVASYYLDGGLTDLAIKQSQEALKIDAKHQGAMLLLSRAAMKKGDVQTAVGYLERIVELNQDNPMKKLDRRLEGVYYDLGKLYTQQGKYPEAIAVLRDALDIDGTDADALFALGVAYQKQNDHDNAVREFEEALRFDPFFGDPYQGLATSYAALGKTKEAAYAQAMVTFTQGNYAEAATRLEAVIGQSPNLTKAYLSLGLAYEKLGKREQAIASLKQYLAVYPDDIAATQAIGRVDREAGQ